jgi:hypothetical protein
MNDGPKLLVEWSSPWQEFCSSIAPAMGRSPARLAGEARTDIFPYRGLLVGWTAEVALLLAVIVLPSRIASLRPYTPPPMPKYDVLYYSGEELPQTEDVGGARSGRSGRAGGQEAHHRTQTIRVARGDSLSEKVVDAPKLNLPRSDAAVANLLAVKTIPGPAPAEGLRSSLRAPALPQMAVVPPAPDVTHDKMRSTTSLGEVVPPPPQVSRDRMQVAPALNASVVPPAPANAQRDIAALRAPSVSGANVIPPPVSAPERDTEMDAKMMLPGPGVVPPPQTEVTRDFGSLGGSGLNASSQQVVPPPAQSGTRSIKQFLTDLLGGGDVVPPPVQANAGAVGRAMGGGLSASGDVVPPPPTVGGGSSALGRGTGNRGGGLGGPLDIGSAVAPPKSGGGANNVGTGVVVSSQPGSAVGVPGKGGAGALAMSPGGGNKPGLGGSGGGSGIGRGNGAGSGFSGEGPGAGKDGSGRGSDPSARGGISPYPGPGGAGRGTNGTPAMPGVSVSGGNTVTLPSFGGNGSDPSTPGRSSADKNHRGTGVTVIASSRAGGAFNFYGALKGDNYTIYVPTSAGTVVMQFADPSSTGSSYAGDLTAPEVMRADVPAGITKARLVVACVLDRSGQLRNIRVLESAGTDATRKIIAALASWKFHPAMRNDQPVEVSAYLGFNIDTN